MPASTAKAVLASETLRWSSPLIFNDPFDVPRELSLGISPQQMAEAYARYIASIIENPNLKTEHMSDKLQLLVEATKNMSSEVKKQVIDSLNELKKEPTQTSQAMNDLKAMWSHIIPSLRILCLTESPSHAAMWYHYADRYAGVVIELSCNEITDSPWLIAKPVNYYKNKLPISSAVGWVEIMALETSVAVNRLIEIATYSKSNDWSYENEWRMVSFKRENDYGLFTDYSFNPEDISGIYFGPLVSEEEKTDLLKITKNFPKVKSYSVSLSISQEFIFNEIVG